MQTGRMKEVFEFVGMAAVAASLIFVGLQLKLDAKTAELELLNQSLEQQRELAVWITENADSWHRGCSGEELSSTDHLIFAQIYNLYFTHNYVRWLRFKWTDFAGLDDGGYLIDAVAANLHRYPGIRRAYEERSTWNAEGRRYRDPYVDEYWNAVNARIAELEKLDPNPQWDVAHCGF